MPSLLTNIQIMNMSSVKIEMFSSNFMISLIENGIFSNN